MVTKEQSPMNTLASPSAIPSQPDGSFALDVGDNDTVNLCIGGMTCQHCPPAIEKALRTVTGVTAASVNLASKSARIEYDPERAKMADILRAIRKNGYTVGTAMMRVRSRTCTAAPASFASSWHCR
jgi:copper chaperone CopZ